MRYKKVRVFFASQHEKEEQWLNSMAARGFAMVSVTAGCFYQFEKCEPGEYIYRLELMKNHISSFESMKYIQFIEDTGAEMMGNVFRWVYFRKKASEGQFDLFSDLDSKVKHFNRIINLILPVMILEISILLMYIGQYVHQVIRYKGFMWSTRYFNHNLFFMILFSVISTMFITIFISLKKQMKRLKKEQLIRE